jgi:hypothetical protein
MRECLPELGLVLILPDTVRQHFKSRIRRNAIPAEMTNPPFDTLDIVLHYVDNSCLVRIFGRLRHNDCLQVTQFVVGGDSYVNYSSDSPSICSLDWKPTDEWSVTYSCFANFKEDLMPLKVDRASGKTTITFAYRDDTNIPNTLRRKRCLRL